MIRVKVCCIVSAEEAKLAIKYGASAVGFVSEMPSGPGVISEELIAEIAHGIPPCISSFLLTSKQDVPSIIAQQKRVRTNTIQLCDRLTEGTYSELREALPGISIVQVIHVGGRESIEEAKNLSGHVNAILLDSGNQSLAIKVLGGTGVKHDWEISREIVRSVDVPVFLAGGLNPDNILEAIETVDPFGVDICNGLRSHGILDEQKLSGFFNKIKNFS